MAVLGDQGAACRLTRTRVCPVPGHPCLEVDPADVLAAVADLTGGTTGTVGTAGTGPGVAG